MERFSLEKFKNININDSFFDSLKNDYIEFVDWFNKKSLKNESAYIQTVNGKLAGFLYLKEECGPISDINPVLQCERAVKIGTMKILPHGTRLGERFIKKSLDFAINKQIRTIYVTVFDKHDALINLFEKYGFEKYASKITSNGVENVLVKDLNIIHDKFIKNYPLINLNTKAYCLSIKPEYHTIMFPDSKLNNESYDVVKDVSHTNSIEKIYICQINNIENIKPGNLLVMRRMTDIPGQARFRAVVSSLCTVESIYPIRNFKSYNNFKDYCKNYSIFDEKTLKYFYNKSGYYVIKMTYNLAFNKKLTNGYLTDTLGLKPDYWGFFGLTEYQLNRILTDAQVNTDYYI